MCSAPLGRQSALFRPRNSDLILAQNYRAKALTSGPQLPALKAMATLPNSIRSLSEAEKFELLDALWVDLEAHSYTMGAEQSKELDLRIAARNS